jgi:hypothetical protein
MKIRDLHLKLLTNEMAEGKDGEEGIVVAEKDDI